MRRPYSQRAATTDPAIGGGPGPAARSLRRYFDGVALRIRTARPDDLEKLQDIFRRSSLSNGDDRQNLLNHPEYLVLPPEPVLEGRSRVAEREGDEIVGFATVEQSSAAAELVDLFVDPDCVRQGVGRALIDDAVAGLRRSAVSDLHVSANGHALPFYLAVGFEVVGTGATPLGSSLHMIMRVHHSS